MDDELTEEEKRKRPRSDDAQEVLDALEAHRAKTRPQWREVEGAWEMSVNGEVVAALLPNHDPKNWDGAYLSVIVTREVPDHGWSNVDFETLADAQNCVEQWWAHAQRGQAYRPDAGPEQAVAANQNTPEHLAAVAARDGGAQAQPETMTLEAIERDPWNAVALDVPADASTELLYRIAAEARDWWFALDDAVQLAGSSEQEDECLERKAQAETRQKVVERRILQPGEALTSAAMRYDPWASVYLDIPPDADRTLLRDAFETAKYCAAAVDGAPGLAGHAFKPDLLGADQSCTTNFALANERLADLVLEVSRDLKGDRLTPAKHQLADQAATYYVQELIVDREPLSLDDVTERVHQLVDNPELLSDEIDQRVLAALDARHGAEAVEMARSAEEEQRLYQPAASEPERSELPAAEPALDAAMPEKMTDDAQIQYDRWTGERIGSPDDGLTHGAGPSIGGGIGHSR